MKNHQLTIANYLDIASFPWKEVFDGCSYPWEALPNILPYIEKLFREGIVKGNYNGRDDVYVGEGTVIQSGVEIDGPAIIGKNCYLGHACLLRNGCILGEGVKIGHAAEIKHAILLNGSAAAHLNFVGDSIIGNEVNISGGAVLANFRLDKKNVYLKIGSERLETGLIKFGSIVGDGCNIGVNAVLNPGTLLGKNCIVYPLSVLKGVYEAEQVIK